MAHIDDEDSPLARALPAQLMAKPVLSFEEFFQGIVGVPDSTAEQAAREEPTPKFFLIGRRRYILMSDVLEYLARRAAAHPYFPRRNKRSAAT